LQFKVGIGQDSHRFEEKGKSKPLVLGGIEIPSEVTLMGNSDADVVLHALCNAISGTSGKVVLGPHTDRLCEQGITDSAVYVKEALKTLKDYKIAHVAVTIECLAPKILPHIDKMRSRIAEILGIKIGDVGITATSGEGLTLFGQGAGIQAFVLVTAVQE
jgi:2-C-methyl-D-erythritol 2,4-cyclodiphosphate synthase